MSIIFLDLDFFFENSFKVGEKTRYLLYVTSFLTNVKNIEESIVIGFRCLYLILCHDIRNTQNVFRQSLV